MRRRDFIGVIYSAALALPFGAAAQQPGKVWRIGDVYLGAPEVGAVYQTALERSLADLGYVPGRSIALLTRYTGSQREEMQEAIISLLPQMDLLVVRRERGDRGEEISRHRADRVCIDRLSGGVGIGSKPRTPGRQHDRHHRRSCVGDERKETADSQRHRTGPQASGGPSGYRHPTVGV